MTIKRLFKPVPLLIITVMVALTGFIISQGFSKTPIAGQILLPIQIGILETVMFYFIGFTYWYRLRKKNFLIQGAFLLLTLPTLFVGILIWGTYISWIHPNVVNERWLNTITSLLLFLMPFGGFGAGVEEGGRKADEEWDDGYLERIAAFKKAYQSPTNETKEIE